MLQIECLFVIVMRLVSTNTTTAAHLRLEKYLDNCAQFNYHALFFLVLCSQVSQSD
jgi:hypothetical protein